MESCIAEVTVDLMEVVEPAGSPPAILSESLKRMIAPPALAPWVAEPTQAAPVKAGAETPGERVRVVISRITPGHRRWKVDRPVPARIVVPAAVDNPRTLHVRARLPSHV